MPSPSIKAVISSFMPVRSSGCGDMGFFYCTAYAGWSPLFGKLLLVGLHEVFRAASVSPVQAGLYHGGHRSTCRKREGPSATARHPCVKLPLHKKALQSCSFPKNMWVILPAKFPKN